MKTHNVAIRNLSFAHTRKRELFRDLSLNLEPGSVYGLLGKNGAGKTTLLQLLAGLIFPKEGACRVFEWATGHRRPEFLSDTFFVAEDMVVPPLTIRTYVSLYAPFYKRFDHGAFARYLGEFDRAVSEWLSELSHGQVKKFFIAFGLAAGTRLLIFDEPTNGLDIPAKRIFRRLLIESMDPERVIVISTHQVRDIQNLIDPILILDRGRLIFQESMERVNRKLRLRLVPDEPAADNALYYDKTIGGYAVLSEGAGGGNIDLELLFNAVLKDKERFASIFGQGAVA